MRDPTSRTRDLSALDHLTAEAGSRFGPTYPIKDRILNVAEPPKAIE